MVAEKGVFLGPLVFLHNYTPSTPPCASESQPPSHLRSPLSLEWFVFCSFPGTSSRMVGRCRIRHVELIIPEFTGGTGALRESSVASGVFRQCRERVRERERERVKGVGSSRMRSCACVFVKLLLWFRFLGRTSIGPKTSLNFP